MLHHVTWFVNSAAHVYAMQEDTAEIPVTTLFDVKTAFLAVSHPWMHDALEANRHVHPLLKTQKH